MKNPAVRGTVGFAAAAALWTWAGPTGLVLGGLVALMAWLQLYAGAGIGG